MIFLPELEKFSTRYDNIKFESLIVRAQLIDNSPIVGYFPYPYLDNLLARAVLDISLNGKGVENTPDAYFIPLPLKVYWTSEKGLPLWDSSIFHPSAEAIEDMIYTHKRPPKAVNQNASEIKTKVGRWMERRLPLPTVISRTWEARCIGNADEILLLLEVIAFLGKRRSIGFGEVENWEVEPAEFDTALIDGMNNQLDHAVPLGCGISCDQAVVRVGWTPPQWKTSLYSFGWPVGTGLCYG